MKRIFLSILLALGLVSAPTASNKTLPEVLQSVAFLEGQDGHCTTFSVGIKQWVTALHCVKEMPDMKINGEDVTVATMDPKLDLALLGGPQVTPLEIASKEPQLGEDTIAIGWPLDWPDKTPLVFFGHVQALGVSMPIEDIPSKEMNFFHEGGGAGMSGGPIVNKNGQVVGIVQASRPYPSVSVAGVTVKGLRKFLRLR